MPVYRNEEEKKAVALIKGGWFNNDPGNGVLEGKNYGFVLKNSGNNFFPPILNEAKEYF